MAYSKREILEELARRRGLDTTAPADAPPAGNTPAQNPTVQAGAPRGDIGGLQRARAALRGLTMGASAPIGATLASVGAKISGDDRGIDDIYDEIRGSLQYEEDQARALAPTEVDQLEMVGSLAGAGGLVAGPLKAATRAALARGSARVGGKKGAATAASRGAKPRVKVKDGKMVEEEGFLAGTGRDFLAGTATDMATGDMPSIKENDEGELEVNLPGGGLQGIVGGRIGKAGANLLLNTAGGRWVLARTMGKLTNSDKVKQAVFMGMHPSTKRGLRRAAAAVFGAQDDEDR